MTHGVNFRVVNLSRYTQTYLPHDHFIYVDFDFLAADDVSGVAHQAPLLRAGFLPRRTAHGCLRASRLVAGG